MIRCASLIALGLALTAAPAHAWQASTDGVLCTLTHSEADAEIRLTHDPSGPLYAIAVTRGEGWSDHPIFGIAFLGGQQLTITTDRHTLSENGRMLTVTDRGFGNVLTGIAENEMAVLQAGETSVTVSLEGAAPEVAAFEACGATPSV